MATYWENSCSFGLRYVSWYKYLIVSLVFSHLGFWSGNLFLIAPFPDLCLLVPYCTTRVAKPKALISCAERDQEKAQSDSHSKNRGGKKNKLTIRNLYHETYRKPNEQLFSQ